MSKSNSYKPFLEMSLAEQEIDIKRTLRRAGIPEMLIEAAYQRVAKGLKEGRTSSVLSSEELAREANLDN